MTNADAPASGDLETLAALVRETLALPADAPLDPDAPLYGELGLTSMDLLDLVFRVEEAFGLILPRGTVAARVRGDLAEAAFAVDGVLTEAGRGQLAAFNQVDPARLPAEIEVAGLPQHLTLRAFAQIVAGLRG